MENNPEPERRSFCLACIYGLGLVIGAALGVPAALYLFLPPRVRKAAQMVEAGSLAQLTIHQPQELTFRENRLDGWKVTSEKATAWVIKVSDDQVLAFSPWCTHLGCAYHWDEQKREFLCPCHGSVFAMDGAVVAGPAPRPLDRYQVKFEGDKILLGPAPTLKESSS